MPDNAEIILQAREVFRKDDATAMRELLGHHPGLKARINEPSAPFDSPPIVCVRSREMLDVLLDAGADINAKSRWRAGGFGLLHNAPPALAADAIERGAVVDVYAAARLGLFDRLKELVGHDPGLVHSRGGDGQTPLHFASTVPIADFLLERGADIDARDVDHESTPAQYMLGGREDVARFLVERGCKTDLLMVAALGDLERVRRHLDAVAKCIRMSASIQSFPKQNPHAGGTIYIWTIGHYKTAHQVAHELGHEEIFQLLMARSPDALKLTVACAVADEPLARELMARHPNLIQSLTDEDRQELAHAAELNNTRAVRAMLAAGWPVDVPAGHGATPLHWAAFHGNLEMAKVILSYGPPLEVNDADFEGTPLGWAIHGSTEGWFCRTGDFAGTVRVLLAAGAKPPAQSQAARRSAPCFTARPDHPLAAPEEPTVRQLRSGTEWNQSNRRRIKQRESCLIASASNWPR